LVFWEKKRRAEIESNQENSLVYTGVFSFIHN
jgi:hypothetical protein